MSQGSWIRYLVWQHTFVSPSAFSRRVVVNYWQKYVHEVLVNHLGGLSLPRKSVVRLTDCPDMTLAVYSGRKTTIQYNTKCIRERQYLLLLRLESPFLVLIIFFNNHYFMAFLTWAPVVQSIVSLTSSLRSQLIKCFTTL